MRILAILIILFPVIGVSSISSSSKKNSKNSSNIIFNVKYSKVEFRFAKHLYDLFKEMDKLKVKPYTIKRLKKLAKKKSAFSVISGQIKKIEKISRMKHSFSMFKKNCPVDVKSGKSGPENLLDKRVRDVSAKYCRGLFAGFLSRQKTSSKIARKNMDYFRSMVPWFLKGEYKRSFIIYLRNMKKNKRMHRLISKIVSTSYIHSMARPDVKILKHITPENDLSSYVYEMGVQKKVDDQHAIKGFKTLRDSYGKAVKKENWEQAVVYMNQLADFYSQNNKLISTTRAWKVFMSGGKKFLYHDRKKDAMRLFRYSKQIGNKSQKEESLFYMLWCHVVTEDFTRGMALIEEYKLVDRFQTLNPKLQFWIAHVTKELGRKYLAKHLFSQLAKTSPLDYYSIVALKKLSEMSHPETEKAIINRLRSPSSVLRFSLKSYKKSFINTLKRLSIWFDMKDDKLAYLEIRELISSSKEKIFKNKELILELSDKECKRLVVMNLVQLLTSKKQFLQTFRLIYKSLATQVIQLNDRMIKLLFPFRYYVEIKKTARGIDPILVLSLIRQESAFNPEATSVAGARGLMQLMPTTAKQIKSKVKTSQLDNPKLNLSIGTEYLKYLLKRYNGNLVYTLAAYNAGESRVKRWIADIFPSDDPLIMIETIPFKETRQYVQLIYRNIFFYQFLKDRIQFSTSVDESFKVSFKR